VTQNANSAEGPLVLVGAPNGQPLISYGTPLTRLNYFDGKFLRSTDLELEQRYLRSIVELSNQAGGSGVEAERPKPRITTGLGGFASARKWASVAAPFPAGRMPSVAMTAATRRCAATTAMARKSSRFASVSINRQATEGRVSGAVSAAALAKRSAPAVGVAKTAAVMARAEITGRDSTASRGRRIMHLIDLRAMEHFSPSVPVVTAPDDAASAYT